MNYRRYRRTALRDTDQVALSEHLLKKGIQCSTAREDDALYIIFDGTSDELDAALKDYDAKAHPRRPGI